MQTITEQRQTNRDRLNAWYRKSLPYLTKRSNTWSSLRVRGEIIKRKWRAYWKQRDIMQSSNIIRIHHHSAP